MRLNNIFSALFSFVFFIR